jgi:hypothetical protein
MFQLITVEVCMYATITIVLQIAVAAAETCIFAIVLQLDCSYTILGLHLCYVTLDYSRGIRK